MVFPWYQFCFFSFVVVVHQINATVTPNCCLNQNRCAAVPKPKTLRFSIKITHENHSIEIVHPFDHPLSFEQIGKQSIIYYAINNTSEEVTWIGTTKPNQTKPNGDSASEGSNGTVDSHENDVKRAKISTQ